MECPRCHTGNRDGRRFCARCGAPLAVACPACGTVNQPREDFCGGCGKALAEDAASPARQHQFAGPERRQLTVMFCDLAGSTVLSHELDPEDLREVIRSYQEGTRQVIARYEGFVARYMGDGMLAYFGYPQAHEDDAARAIHAGLEIVAVLDHLDVLPTRESSVPLRVRVGIATGLVIVGDLIGEGASEQAAAVGETPNLAARLQALAEPNSVVVAEGTRNLAGGRFEYADQGAHKLKGFDTPVRVWRVLRTSAAESRFDAARTRRLTPFVGRSEELDLLFGRWRRATEGAGQVILLVGEAGIGKSRIAETLTERIADEPYIRLRYQCSPYHANSAFYPFIQQLERAADFGRDDTADQKLDKLEALLAKSTPEIGESGPLFAALLSLPTSGRYPAPQLTPQQQKQKTLSTLLERTRGLAARGPVFMLLEDAHWIDPTSIELLDLLARHIQGVRVLLLITSRVAANYSWLGLQHVKSLPLERLDRRESVTIVESVLGGEKLPAKVIEEVVAKTDGVPLFIEEFTRTLAAYDVAREGEAAAQIRRSEVPSTLQDSLMARLDQLGVAKEVAQMGAVIGREFSRDLLAALSSVGDHELGDALSRLVSSTVVFDRGQPPGTIFMFKHALVQDAAYSSLLRSKRQELHRRVAETLESSYPERVRTEPEVIAHHYTHAGQGSRAAKYWAAAALRALDRSANVEALGHATKGLELVAGGVPSPERDRLELGLEILRGAAYRAVRGFASSQVERSFTRALALCERLDDIPRLIDVRRGLFSFYYARGSHVLAREQGRQMVILGQRMDDRSARMLGHWMLGCIATWQGDFRTARQELEDAVALYHPKEQMTNTLALQIDPRVSALFHLSWVWWFLGYPGRAIETSDNAIRIARELSQPLALAMALFFACETRACCGRHASAGRLLDELIAVTAEHGLGYLASCARILKGQELIAQDRCVDGIEQVDRALSEFQAQEAGLGLPWSKSISATGYARLGRIEEGLATIAAALDATSRNNERHWEAELWRLQGELLLMRSAAIDDEAEACFRRAIEVARQQSAKSLELRATMSLFRLLDRHGETGSAREILAEVFSWFGEGFDTTDIRVARAMLQGAGSR